MDLGVLKKDALYLGRVDILGPADDHVLFPPLNVKEAIVIQATQIPGMTPSIHEGLCIGLWMPPVSLGYYRTLYQNLTGFPRLQGVSFIVCYPYINVQ